MRSRFLLLLLPLLFSIGACAQPPKTFTGSWTGVINAGVEVRIVFHISESNSHLVTTIDSPDQSVFGIATDETVVNGDEISVSIKKMFASFKGKMLNDSTISGTFSQGASTPLLLKKTTGPIAKLQKPQTPQAPFPYKSENITYHSKDKNILFGATLTLPQGKGPFPAVVLISGSGIQNRDGDMMGHSFLWVLADHLTRNGIAVLRYDERGIGESTGDFMNATTRDFANDVGAGLDYLLSRPEVNKNKVGLVGHSEGGLIAPMLAAERKDINFIVLLAGPGVYTLDMMAEQNEALAKNSGISDEAAKEFRQLYKQIVTSIFSNPTAPQETLSLLNAWAADKNKKTLEELNLSTPGKREGYVTAMSQQLQSAWLKYFMSVDPATYLEKLTCKVLALNGDKDIQVVAASNLAGINASLKKSKSPYFETKELPGLNHLFQTCTTCSIDEYGRLDETFSPPALNFISNWIDKHIK